MLYDIIGLVPRVTENGNYPMNQYSFNIRLFPKWRELVSQYDIDQDKVNYWCRETMGPIILRECGFRYGSIRIHWGEWGLENIKVPGNACGLDLMDSFDAPQNGKTLLPHNIDSMKQAFCLLCTFTWFASDMITDYEYKQYKNNK